MSTITLDSKMFNNKDLQAARTLLRERFLRCISSLQGNHCEMKTTELTQISGNFQNMDIHVTEMFVKNLSTPYSEMKNSLVRTSDVLYVKFPQLNIN